MTHSEPRALSAAGRHEIRRLLSAVPPWALVVIAIVSVQIGAAFAKQLFETAGPSGVVFLRTLLAGILFMLIWRPSLRGYSRRDLAYLGAYGVIIAAMMLVFYASIERIPLGISVAIAFAGPLGVAVIGSRKAVDLLWVALAAGGVLLLSPFSNVNLDPVGVLLALLSAASWAIYILLSSRVSKRFPGNTALAVAMCVAALAALPFGISGASRVLTDPMLILLALVVALLSSAVPFALEFMALRTLPPRTFGTLVSLEPVVASFIGLLLLHEALGFREVIGIGLVTVAAIATARTSSH